MLARRSAAASRGLTILAAVVAGGCVVGPGPSDPPVPATVRPPAGITAQPSASPEASVGPSEGPSASASPSASDRPSIALVKRLPHWAAGDSLEPQELAVTDVLEVPKSPFAAVLQRLGARAGGLELALGRGSDVQLMAMRLAGTTSDDLADAWVATIEALYPGTTVDERTTAGHSIRRLRETDAGNTLDEQLWADGDVVFSMTSQDDRTAGVDDLVAYLARPPLDSIFPGSVGGQIGQGFSIQGTAIGTGGDVCAGICPGEPQAIAKILAVPITDVDVALWGAGRNLIASAFRIATSGHEDLIEARIRLLGRSATTTRDEIRLGGKTVVRYARSPLPGEAELLYTAGNVLVVVREPGPDPATGQLSPETAAQLDELFRALP